jgi:hypothetical protein
VHAGISWEKLKARGHFENPKGNFKVNFKDIGWEEVDWIHMA